MTTATVYHVILDDPGCPFGPRFIVATRTDRDEAHAVAAAIRVAEGHPADDDDYVYVIKAD